MALQLLNSVLENIDQNGRQKSKQKGATDNKDNSSIPCSKHFIQSLKTTVMDSIDGALYHNPHITKLYHKDTSIKVVIRSDWKSENKNLGDQQVAVIGGGGSGHYPCFWGFVGKGMLTASVNGEIFAAPPTIAIVEAIRAVSGKKGVLLVYNNYTGDILNLSLAAKIARTKYGMNVKQLICDDDCAITRSKNGRVGRRGLAGVVLLMKIVTYYANQGMEMDDIIEIGQYYIDNMGTIGVAGSSCYLPGAVKKIQRMSDDKLELGMGAHGESGARVIDFDNICNIIEQMFDILLDESADRNYFCVENDIILMINNMGGLAHLEMGIIKKYVIEYIMKHKKWNNKVNIARIFVGEYITSFDMRGFSITIMNATNPCNKNDKILNALDSKVNCPSFVCGSKFKIDVFHKVQMDASNDDCDGKEASDDNDDDDGRNRQELTVEQSTFLEKLLGNGCNALIENKNLLNELDFFVGDGDCGSTLCLGAQCILDAMKNGVFGKYNCLSFTFMKIGELLSLNMGGTSGALYAYLFISAGNLIKQNINENEKINNKNLGVLLQKAVNELSEYCGAKINDRTMLDALFPAAQALVDNIDLETDIILQKCAESAENGAQSTKDMIAKLGRTMYLNEQTQTKYIDPGAKGVSIIINAFTK